jgi:hypothetical protein
MDGQKGCHHRKSMRAESETEEEEVVRDSAHACFCGSTGIADGLIPCALSLAKRYSATAWWPSRTASEKGVPPQRSTGFSFNFEVAQRYCDGGRKEKRSEISL